MIDQYKCEVCQERRGSWQDHSKCSKILQAQYRDKERRPKPVHEGTIRMYMALYQRF
jgi:hypothetical protein